MTNKDNENIIPGFDNEKHKDLKLNLYETTSEDVIIVAMTGYIDTYNTSFFDSKIDLVLKKYDKIILDLAGINYISSTGIGAFTRLLKILKQKNGNMVFVNAVPKVFEVFNLLGFTSFFNFKLSSEAALEFFKENNEIKQIFPLSIQCPICEKNLKAPKPGKFKCPSCQQIIKINDQGEIFIV